MLAVSWFALVVCGLLGAVWMADKRRSSLVVAALWAAYAVYEYLMHARVLCTGECNIRVDLLLIWPALLLLTMAIAVGHARRAWSRRRERAKRL